MKTMKSIAAIAAITATIALCGCSTTNPQSEQTAVTTIAALGTTGALLAYPQYRPGMVLADDALSAVCASTNGISATTVEQILAQSGSTNTAINIGISGAITLLDLYASSQVTNGIPAEQTIQQGSCWISDGMSQALYGTAAKAPAPKKHLYYLWLK